MSTEILKSEYVLTASRIPFCTSVQYSPSRCLGNRQAKCISCWRPVHWHTYWAGSPVASGFLPPVSGLLPILRYGRGARGRQFPTDTFAKRAISLILILSGNLFMRLLYLCGVLCPDTIIVLFLWTQIYNNFCNHENLCIFVSAHGLCRCLFYTLLLFIYPVCY